MIIWGGYGDSEFLDDGGRYDPITDSWILLPIAGAPTVRYEHTSIWTGSEMIVWGGWDGEAISNGGRFGYHYPVYLPIFRKE
jgi:hypothetical protein